MIPDRRVVAWFSCGACSAVATKMALATHGHDITIAYVDATLADFGKPTTGNETTRRRRLIIAMIRDALPESGD